MPIIAHLRGTRLYILKLAIYRIGGETMSRKSVINITLLILTALIVATKAVAEDQGLLEELESVD